MPHPQNTVHLLCLDFIYKLGFYSADIMFTKTRALQHLIMNNMRVSGELPPRILEHNISSGNPNSSTDVIETFSITRNSFVGSSKSLDSAVNLKTLLLNSNFLSCEIAKLEGAQLLGTG